MKGKWPDDCACGHSGYLHHGRLSNTGGVWGFGPETFCTGDDHNCDCDRYAPRAAR